jgi:hypothetical protein
VANYYYNKYNSIYGYSDSAPFDFQGSFLDGGTGISGYSSYSFDATSNIYSPAGSYNSLYNTQGTAYVTGNPDYVSKYVFVKYSGPGVQYDEYKKTVANNSRVYLRGSLVQSNIIAPDGTYPANGRHTDGYWYVRGSLVPFPAISVNIGVDL